MHVLIHVSCIDVHIWEIIINNLSQHAALAGYQWSQLLWTEVEEGLVQENGFAHVVYQHYTFPGGYKYDFGRELTYRSGFYTRYALPLYLSFVF